MECNATAMKFCGRKECIKCWNKSFAGKNNEKVKYWSIKNNKSPREVFPHTGDKYIFNCDKDNCAHEFLASLVKVSQGHWCPFCANQKLCENESCLICLDKSFAKHPKAIYWSENNTKKPFQVFMNSRDSFLFQCNKCINYEFLKRIDSISSGTWCPLCMNPIEKKLYHLLLTNHQLKHQVKFDWCGNIKTKRKFPFDFGIINDKILLESDSVDHFNHSGKTISLKERQQRDIYKMNLAFMYGYTIIRINQKDIQNDNSNWLEQLKSHIYLHEKPEIIYISSNNCYDVYKQYYENLKNKVVKITLLSNGKFKIKTVLELSLLMDCHIITINYFAENNIPIDECTLEYV